MNDHFGKWLTRQIEERLQTQQAFADSCGVPFWTLRNWLKSPFPSIRGVNLIRLSRALGISREEIESLLDQCRTAAA